MQARENALKEWLVSKIPHHDFILTPLAGDASFRRYFRLKYDGLSQIVMDAPPGKEDLAPFIQVANTFAKANIHAPQILAMDVSQGFLLLSDFGDQLLLEKLNETTADEYYRHAIETLLSIQTCSVDNPKVPAFDKSFMLKEMGLCTEWFFNNYLSLKLDNDETRLIHNTFEWIAQEVSQQPLTFIHRDYHSRNLMIIHSKVDMALGVIDFQDAMCGPITYDLVSLLKDCYISWPREKVLSWVSYFYQLSPLAQSCTLPEFIRAFDLCGLQRHIKVLGVFSRLYLRDGKAGYLKDLPLVLRYVLECSETYDELHSFYHFLQKRVSLP